MSYIQYAAVGRNAAWRYIVGTGLAVFTSIALGVAVLTPLMIASVVPADSVASWMSPANPVAFMAFNGAAFALVLAGFVVAARLLHGKRPGDVVGAWRWRTYAAGAGAWIATLVVLSLIDLAIAPHGFSLSASPATLGLAAAAVVALSVQTFAEEFVFRGYLTGALLLAFRRPLPAALVSGLIFGAVHIPNGWPQAAGATVFGVFLALIAIRTGSLAFGAGLHFANNLFGAVVLASRNDVFAGVPAAFTQDTPHLMWWDTIAGALALAVIAGLVLRAQRRHDESI
jgi:membrane protease YdiL (CAAX protease family)